MRKCNQIGLFVIIIYIYALTVVIFAILGYANIVIMH